jgi:hypothetical protein
VTQGGQPTKVIGRLSDDDGIGVLGEATGSGSTTGVWGTVDSSDGEGVYGEGKTGIADGVFGEATGAGSTQFGFEVAGVRGVANSSNSSSGSTYGVIARNYNEHDFATGVLGVAGGGLFSTDNNPADARGVLGLANSSGDGSAGVYGEANASSGETYGLKAVNNSTTAGAAAIRAEGTHDGIQVTGAENYGISVDLTGIDADGGINVDAGSGSTDGVHATCDSDNYWSIWGTHNATSGSSAYAGYFTTDSNEAGAVYAGGSGGGAIDANGYVDASQGYRGAIGSRAYLSSTFSVGTSEQTIPFDTLSADQRNEFDTTNNYFECAYDGTYAVELGIESTANSTGNIGVDVAVLQGSASTNPASGQQINYDFDANGAVARTFSTTIYGLLAGNRIEARISDGAGSMALTSSEDETFLSVRQVGGGGQYTSSPSSDSVVVEDPEGE